MTHPAYDLYSPAVQSTCVIFASPHSGRAYSAAFLAQTKLNSHAIRSSEDAYMDELFADAPSHGAPLIAARTPRAYVDFNRAPEELDPALIDGVRRISPNPRVASGLGVIPRVVAGGRVIYDGKISLEQAHARITQHWRPWHDRLQTLLDESARLFGQSVLIDCHSMPHEALDNITGPRPDVVIGDRFGASASPALVEEVSAALSDAGLRCVRNAPFAGAYVAQHYGKPGRHQHAIQIEVDRALYMNEQTLEKRADFDDLRRLMGAVAARIAAAGAADDRTLAAE
jgi:N-formylglutamate amidohydrolase